MISSSSNKIGYAIATFMFVVALAIGATSLTTDNIISQLFILSIMGLLILGGILMLKEIGDQSKKEIGEKE